MKTIAQVANENGVSVQTIYRKIKKLKIKPTLNDGVKCLTGEDEKLITDDLTPVKRTPNDSNGDLLQEVIRTLQNQLSVKDSQIQELNEGLKKALQLNENNQLLLRAEQEKSELPPVEKKLNIVQRIFSREKKEG